MPVLDYMSLQKNNPTILSPWMQFVRKARGFKNSLKIAWTLKGQREIKTGEIYDEMDSSSERHSDGYQL